MRQKNHIEGIRYVTCQAICVMYYENISLIQNCFYDTNNKLPHPMLKHLAKVIHDKVIYAVVMLKGISEKFVMNYIHACQRKQAFLNVVYFLLMNKYLHYLNL